MSRPAVFTQGDVSKLLKGAKAAGMTVTSIEIDRTGKIVAQLGTPGNDAAPANEWDVVLDVEKKRPAKGRH